MKRRNGRLARVPQEEVGIAIGVEVAPGGGPHRALHLEPELGGHVDEPVDAIVAVEPAAGAVEADEAVGITVAVDVRPGVGQRPAVLEELGLPRREGDRLGRPAVEASRPRHAGDERARRGRAKPHPFRPRS